MEQAIQDLYNELLRLKAKGIQSLYVDSQSIMALEAALQLHSPSNPMPPCPFSQNVPGLQNT